MIAGSDKRGHLMSQEYGVLRPAMAQNDRVSGMLPPRFEDFQLDAIDGKQGSALENRLLSTRLVLL